MTRMLVADHIEIVITDLAGDVQIESAEDCIGIHPHHVVEASVEEFRYQSEPPPCRRSLNRGIVLNEGCVTLALRIEPYAHRRVVADLTESPVVAGRDADQRSPRGT